MQEVSKMFDDLLAVQLELKNPSNDSSGYGDRYKYIKLPTLLNSIKPVLNKYNFVVIQGIFSSEVVTKLLHKSGEEIVSGIPLQIYEGDAQKTGSWITYMKRYTLMSLLAISSIEEDDDGEVTKTPMKYNAEDVKLVKEALEVSPDDKFVKSVAEGLKKYGQLTEKQRKALADMIADKDLYNNASQGDVDFYGEND